MPVTGITGVMTAVVSMRTRPANVTFQAPTGVAETLPPTAQPVTSILWRPDLPTGGSPVQAAAQPAPTSNASA